ncbi:MAG: UbiD family decarboxylase, partial [Geopsychrobacter sp.]|nr:UbiD family decarboxylase [Geopsychrobacter sp.]
GQLSLAKYLLMIAENDNPRLDIHDIPAFFSHLLERVDWRRDLHFQTSTTIDTLDYSGDGLNRGSKVVIAAVGAPRRELPLRVPDNLKLAECFSKPHLALPGLLLVEGPACRTYQPGADLHIEQFCASFDTENPLNLFPLILIVDDSEFCAAALNNWLWVAFTRSNPAADIYGVGGTSLAKHWGCEGPLVIDARIKPQHAPPLIDDPQIEKKIDELGAKGGPLHGII